MNELRVTKQERALETAKKMPYWTTNIKKALRNIKRNTYELKYKELVKMIQKNAFNNWFETIENAEHLKEDYERLKLENAKLRKEIKELRCK